MSLFDDEPYRPSREELEEEAAVLLGEVAGVARFRNPPAKIHHRHRHRKHSGPDRDRMPLGKVHVTGPVNGQQRLANVQGIASLPIVRLERRIGRISDQTLDEIRVALIFALDLHTNIG